MEGLDLDLMGSGSGSGIGTMNETFFNPYENCTLFSHCGVDDLSDTGISCPPLWTIYPPHALEYTPYIAAIEAVFFVIAFFWNLFILISYIVHRGLLKEPANIYLFNLALTDFMLAVFVVLQCFVTESMQAFLIGDTDVVRCGLCQYLGFMLMFLMASTLHTLAMLSFDRFFLLVRPLSYKQYFNWKRAIVIVACVWALSFCIAIPPFLGLGTYGFSSLIGNCHPQWDGYSYRGVHNFNYITFVAAEAVIPIVFLTFTNIVTYRIVTNVLRKRFKRQESFTESGRETKVAHNRQQVQLVKVFGALFAAHVVCWVPVLVCVAIGLIVDPDILPVEVIILGWILYLTNPVVHPILETFFVKDLRSRVNRAQKKMQTSIRRMSSMGHSFVQRSTSGSSLRSQGSIKGRSESIRSDKRGSVHSTDTMMSKVPLSSKSSLIGSSLSESPPTSPPVSSSNGIVGNGKISSVSSRDVTFTILEEPELQVTPHANGGVPVIVGGVSGGGVANGGTSGGTLAPTQLAYHIPIKKKPSLAADTSDI